MSGECDFTDYYRISDSGKDLFSNLVSPNSELMKRKILLAILLISFVSGYNVCHAQIGILGKVKDKVNERANKKVDESIDKGLDKAEDPAKKTDEQKQEETPQNNSGESSSGNASPKSATTNTSEADTKTTMIAYGKYDFVPGTQIIFQDDLTGESAGEFPSKWDLDEGKTEVATIDGQNVIAFLNGNYATIFPYWKDKSDYLPEVFSVEFDHYVPEGSYQQFALSFRCAKGGAEYVDKDDFTSWIITGQSATAGSAFGNYVGEYNNKWHHIALSYNKGNVKIYSDQYRMCIAPHMNGNPYNVEFGCIANEERPVYIKNIRIAAGGGNLYQRVMSDGKFTTRGILFDVNKSTIKPQSMGSINEIYAMMKEHPELKFEIDGHTDADGNVAANLKLSQERADAVKAQLASMGVDVTRLSSKGYGSGKPVSPNDTPEGKANNRRVEFIKQ